MFIGGKEIVTNNIQENTDYFLSKLKYKTFYHFVNCTDADAEMSMCVIFLYF